MLTLLVTLAAAASPAQAATTVSVSPRVGSTRTTFIASFRAPRELIAEDVPNTEYVVVARGRCGKRELYRSGGTLFARGQRVRARLRTRGRLCRGLWRATLVLDEVNPSSSCDSGDAPASSCRDTTTLGRFSFRVR